MAISLFATLENKHLKLSWSDDTTRLWPYCVLLSSVQANAEKIRAVLKEITQNDISTGRAEYVQYLSRLGRAGADLFSSLFDARDNASAAQDAEDMIRQAPGRSELSVFSEICVPWG